MHTTFANPTNTPAGGWDRVGLCPILKPHLWQVKYKERQYNRLGLAAPGTVLRHAGAMQVPGHIDLQDSMPTSPHTHPRQNPQNWH